MLGYTALEAAGRLTPLVFHLAFELAIHGDALSDECGRLIRGLDAIVERARQGGYEERERTYVRKDGRHLTVNVVVTTLRNPDQSPAGFLYVATELTERTRAQVVQAQLAAIVESSDEAIFSKTLDGIITSWNAGAERLFGCSQAEIIGSQMLRLSPPDRLDGQSCNFNRAHLGRLMRWQNPGQRNSNGGSLSRS